MTHSDCNTDAQLVPPGPLPLNNPNGENQAADDAVELLIRATDPNNEFKVEDVNVESKTSSSILKYIYL